MEIKMLVDTWMRGNTMPKKIVELWRSRGVPVNPRIDGELETFRLEHRNRCKIYHVSKLEQINYE